MGMELRFLLSLTFLLWHFLSDLERLNDSWDVGVVFVMMLRSQLLIDSQANTAPHYVDIVRWPLSRNAS